MVVVLFYRPRTTLQTIRQHTATLVDGALRLTTHLTRATTVPLLTPPPAPRALPLAPATPTPLPTA